MVRGNNECYHGDLVVVQESSLMQELLLHFLVASTDLCYLGGTIVGLSSCCFNTLYLISSYITILLSPPANEESICNLTLYGVKGTHEAKFALESLGNQSWCFHFTFHFPSTSCCRYYSIGMRYSQ